MWNFLPLLRASIVIQESAGKRIPSSAPWRVPLLLFVFSLLHSPLCPVHPVPPLICQLPLQRQKWKVYDPRGLFFDSSFSCKRFLFLHHFSSIYTRLYLFCKQSHLPFLLTYCVSIFASVLDIRMEKVQSPARIKMPIGSAKISWEIQAGFPNWSPQVPGASIKAETIIQRLNRKDIHGKAEGTVQSALPAVRRVRSYISKAKAARTLSPSAGACARPNAERSLRLDRCRQERSTRFGSSGNCAGQGPEIPGKLLSAEIVAERVSFPGGAFRNTALY